MAIKSKKIKVAGRQRVKIRIRKRISGTEARPRMSVFKSSKHIYAQLVDDITGKTLAAASSLEKEAQTKAKSVKVDDQAPKTTSTKSVAAAHAVGLLLAERCKGKNIGEVVFDRNGFVYHGRIKAVADGARAGGLKF